MVKAGMISVLRKLKGQWLQGSIFLLALSISYILLVNGVFYRDWALAAFSIAIIIALHLGEQPLISKSEIRLHKIFGASYFSIWPLIAGQTVVKTFIIALVALAISGVSQLDAILPLNSLFELSNLWVLLVSTTFFLLLLGILHFRLFTKTNAVFSMK